MVNFKVLGAVVAASSLGLSAVSFAEGNTSAQQDKSGVYVEGDLGYNIIQGDKAYQTPMSDLTDEATQNGFDNSHKFSNGHFAGRAAAGYQFNQYVALEAGFDYLGNTNYTATIVGGPTDGKLSARTSAIAYDLAAKGILPLSVISESLSNVNVFAKVGAALVGTKSYYLDSDESPAVNTGITKRKYQVAPEFGAGLGYDFDSGLGMNVSYTRIQGRHKVSYDSTTGYNIPSNFVPSSNLILAGVSYRFAV